ncbi:ABC transporter permease [Zobellella iuensis]|uniref:ABC transporter permease n=1 Tax=Zobellella iuensis TaxID=2803811 RepID=A0ABS1QN82_9GAMM|nr:ABC transporter permease [Zobellella iuensis]MBL1376315.1 ABC transporter permease [Zobellella iuensis]
MNEKSLLSSITDHAGGYSDRPWTVLRGRWKGDPMLLLGLSLLLMVSALAWAAPFLYPVDPLAMVGMPLLWPGEDPLFPLGTDSLGRDLAAAMAHGARTSLVIGLGAAGLSLVIGILIGALGGYFGGWLDMVLLRLTELFQTMPAFLLVVVMLAIGEATLGMIHLAIGLASWPEVARLARSEFRRLQGADFVLAARGMGFSHWHIMTREILPNALPPLIVTGSVLVAGAILTESGLSFLGLSDPNVVSWGSMIGASREQLGSAWFLTVLPGSAIILLVLAFNLLGDGINDLLNPRTRSAA